MQILHSILRKKLVLAVLGAAIVGSAAYAFAATLGVSSNSLGAGDAAVSSCDTNGLKTSFTTSFDSTTLHAYKVGNIVVSDIAAACVSNSAPATLSVELTTDTNGDGTGTKTYAAAFTPVALTTTPAVSGLVDNGDGTYTYTQAATGSIPAHDLSHVDASLSS